MPDTRISALPTNAVRSLDDDIPHSDTGATATEKFTVQQVQSHEHGQLKVTAGAASQTLSVGGTPEKVDQFTADGTSFGGVTVANATDTIALTENGIYEISGFVSFEGTAAKDVDFYAYYNAISQGIVGSVHTLNGTQRYTVALHGYITVATAANLELWFDSTSNSDVCLIVEASFAVRMVSA